MDTRATGGGLGTTPDTGRPDIEVRRDGEPPVVIVSPAPPGQRSSRVAVLAAAALVALLLAVAGGVWLVRGGDEDVAATPSPAAAKPAGPAALRVSVEPPAAAVAGRPTTLVVGYNDGLGVYSGSTEDWGDGVGASSVSLGQCDQSVSAGPARGSYRATHTWAEPGRYTVTIEVTTYSCEGGQAVEERASTSVDVTVAAR